MSQARRLAVILDANVAVYSRLMLPVAGPRSGFIFIPPITGSNSPYFTVAVLNTKEFYQGILARIDGKTLEYYVSEGFPRHVLFDHAAALRLCQISQRTEDAEPPGHHR